jgi:coenzyme PQQ precursor peptide PqqA
MREKWTKPDYQEISVGGECTAYAAARVPTTAERIDVGEASRTGVKGCPELHEASVGECRSSR